MKRKGVVSVVLLLGLLLSGVASAEGLDMEFKQAPLGDVFQVLGEIAGYNVLIDPSVQGTVSFYLKDLSVSDALDLIARTTGYGYEIVNNTLVVASTQRLQMDFASSEYLFLGLKNVSVTAASQLVQVIVPNVKTYSDKEHNLIVLYGTKEQVNYVKALLEQYDRISQGIWAETQDLPTNDKGLETYRMPIHYGEGEAITKAVQRLYPHRNFTWDNNLGLLTAVAAPDEWQQIADIVNRRDLPNFVIKGLITTDTKTLVLVDYEGTTSLVEKGESILNWLIAEVIGKEVTFSQEEREFTVTIGR